MSCPRPWDPPSRSELGLSPIPRDGCEAPNPYLRDTLGEALQGPRKRAASARRRAD